MKISELILKLKGFKNKEGDLNVCISEHHEYWGSYETYLTDSGISVKNVMPNGPKSGKQEKALVLEANF